MHTLSEFLCILLQDKAEQPVHRSSGRPIFSPLRFLDEAYSEHLGGWKGEIIFFPALPMLCPWQQEQASWDTYWSMLQIIGMATPTKPGRLTLLRSTYPPLKHPDLLALMVRR